MRIATSALFPDTAHLIGEVSEEAAEWTAAGRPFFADVVVAARLAEVGLTSY